MGVIIYIEQCDRARNREKIHQYLQLRKRIFCDRYEWVQAHSDGTESDELDDTYGVVILYLDPGTEKVIGGVRLVPTTGPTLVHSVWSEMLPHPEDFRSPHIWEATRFCVDETSNIWRKRNFVNRVTLALSVAIIDFSHANDISHIIGVCEKKFFDMSSSYGAEAEILSIRIDQSGTQICCGVWPSGEAIRNTLLWARPFIGGAQPIKVKAA